MAGDDKPPGRPRQAWQPFLARFVRGRGRAPVQIHEALATGDLAEAERLAHTREGVAGNIGATAVARMAADVEHALRSYQPPAAVQDRLRLLERSLGPLVAALAQRLQGPEPAESA